MINILHISDIHFRADESSEKRQYRKDVLDKLIKYICLLKDEQRPNIILVTGDIAYFAKDEEYQLALEWFNELSASTGIPHNQIFFCPGNHDVNRKARTIGGALRIRESANASDNDFKRWQYKFYPLFESYTKFCSAFKSIPYRFGRKFKPSYIIGGRPVANEMINIICLNSSWYHFDIETAVYGNLWMGLPLLKEMNGFQLPMESEYDKSAINIGLCHHPKDWLHKDERIKYVSDTGDREVTWEYLLNRIHIMFHGHIEGENIFLPQQNGKRGYEIIGGALYYKPQHQHSFNIIRLNVEDRNFEYYAYQYKNNDWSLVPNTDDNKYDLMANKKTTLRITSQIIYPTISLHIENLPLTVYKDFLVKVRFFDNAVLDNEMSFYTKITIEKSNNHIEISNDDDILRSLNLHMSFNMQGLAPIHLTFHCRKVNMGQ